MQKTITTSFTLLFTAILIFTAATFSASADQLPGGDFITVPELFPGMSGALVPRHSLDLDHATDIVWGSILGTERADVVLKQVFEDVPILISGILPIDGKDHLYLGIGRQYYTQHGSLHIYRALKKRFPFIPIHIEASDGVRPHGIRNILFSDTFDEGLDAWNASAVFSANQGWGVADGVAETQDCPWICNLITATPLDLSSYESVTLSFDRWIDDNVNDKEGLAVLIGNGTTYTRLDRWTGEDGDSAWQTETYVLDNPGDTVFIRFSATTSSTYGYEPKRIAIDNVTVTATPSTLPDEEDLEESTEEDSESQPNLTLQSIVATPLLAISGESFNVQVTVRNEGVDPIPTETITIYRHQIRATDPRTGVATGTITVDNVATDTTETATLTVPVPSVSEQTVFYYYACTDTSCTGTPAFIVAQPAEEQGESVESGEEIEHLEEDSPVNVEEAEQPEEEVQEPNIALSPVTVTPTTTTPGGRITLSAQATMTGTDVIIVRTVRIYRHESPADNPRIGGTEAGALGKIFFSNASIDVTMNSTAPLTPATYYYYLCVDALPDERIIDDNCSGDPAEVTVQAAPDEQAVPDTGEDEIETSDTEEEPVEQEPNQEQNSNLIVSSIGAIPSPITSGETLEIRFVVKNIGNAVAPPATVTIYQHRSATTDPTSGGTSIGNVVVGSMAANALERGSLSIDAPTVAEQITYHYYACVNEACVDVPALVTVNPSSPVTVEPEPVKQDRIVMGGDTMSTYFIERDAYHAGGTITLGGLENADGLKGFIVSAHVVADLPKYLSDNTFLDGNTGVVLHFYKDPKTGNVIEHYLGRVLKLPHVRIEGTKKFIDADAAFVAYTSDQTLGCSKTWRDLYDKTVCLDFDINDYNERVAPLVIRGDSNRTYSVIGSQQPTEGLDVTMYGQASKREIHETINDAGRMLIQYPGSDVYTYVHYTIFQGNGTIYGDSGAPVYTRPDRNGNISIVGVHYGSFDFANEGNLGSAISAWSDVAKEFDLKPIE